MNKSETSCIIDVIVFYNVLTNESELCPSFAEWIGVRKTLDLPEELTHNGRSEPQQPEEPQVLPVAAAAAPLAQVNNSCMMLT